MENSAVISPCVGICSLGDDDLCIGCQRSGEEISNWGALSDEERKAVLQLVAEREKEKYGW